MKRKNSCASPTEEYFDSFMAKNNRNDEVLQDDTPEADRQPCDSAETKETRPTESDKDSDYGGSDCDNGEATTFRMLFEKIQVSELEVIGSLQEAGLVCRRAECPGCRGEMGARLGPPPAWACPACPGERPLGPPWLGPAPPALRLRDGVLLSYCWARNYPRALASHEVELRDPALAGYVYARARTVSWQYFNNEMSNIGGPSEVVDVEQIQTTEGRWAVGGVEASNSKMAFLRILPSSWTRDDVVSILADNVAEESILRCHEESPLITTIGSEGIDYLESVWRLKVQREVCNNCRTPEEGTSVSGIWSEFLRTREGESPHPSPPSPTQPDRPEEMEEESPDARPPSPAEREEAEEAELREFLFRKRMDSSKDPFLFFMAIAAALFPPS